MSLIIWIIFFTANSLFWKWLISWGGAEKLNDTWFGAFMFAPFSWNEEQIKLFAQISWLLETIWFILGLFKPELRFA
ncbi:hypothetical protein [Neisseria sp. Ec49-e6-T10]|uniref:hypothetical protein n=1 Tax=Neisseria sp. Ec49-e6-T10 TaxID=3140744 RepID=UPI003EB8471E